MPRLHLFEIEDQRWCPAFLRNFLTDYLKHFEESTNIYECVAPIIKKGLESSKEKKVVDLCSGSSGPWSSLLDKTGAAQVTMTDLYPNKNRIERLKLKEDSRIVYFNEPVNAMNVQNGLRGLRTLFTSFHHFRKKEAASILKNSLDSGEPIAIFEFTERSLFNYFFSPIAVILAVLLVTPSIQPRKISRFIFTYLIPVVPLMVAWDGYVSNLRTYSPHELQSLVDGLEDDTYEWDIGVIKTKLPGISITYMLGKAKVTASPRQEIEKPEKLAEAIA